MLAWYSQGYIRTIEARVLISGGGYVSLDLDLMRPEHRYF